MTRIFGKFTRAQKEMKKLLGARNVRTDEVTLALNSYDGSPGRSMPEAVLNITDAQLLPQAVKILSKYNIPFVPRSAATNHDGGAVPLKGGAVLNLTALDKIIDINTEEGYAIVEPAVVNQNLQDAVLPLGFFYAPDPASMAFSTIGGNCALNAGGAKTLKYGSCAANILGAQIVMPNGELLDVSQTAPGPDLAALLTRGEGTLGIIKQLKVKIIKNPPAVKTVLAYFASLEDTINTVRAIIAAGILPSALEAMDKTTMDATQTPYPKGMEALLIIELDSPHKTIEKEIKIVTDILLQNKALKIETAATGEDRQKLWAKRKAAASSLSRLAPGLMSLDAAFPRSVLPQAIMGIREIFKKYTARGGMVFHAGDGNVHPNIVFDPSNLFEASRVQKAVKEIHALTVALGGSISGEHGIGIEKRAAMAFMYDGNTLNLFRKIKTAVDPRGVSNPDKVLPVATAGTKHTPAPEYLHTIIAQIKQNYKTGKAITITGLNTKLKADKKNSLSMAGFNKILDIDAANYTATVQAGVSLKELAQKLAAHNMHLPAAAARGSIGGAFAAKTFYNLADYITGLDFILPDGSYISLGGKHVKNSAGYDLIRFLHGGMGAYALITALTIRTFAAPPVARKENKFELFKPDAVLTKLKNVFDEKNLFNPFIFKAGAR